jgi:hypothetical protein
MSGAISSKVFRPMLRFVHAQDHARIVHTALDIFLHEIMRYQRYCQSNLDGAGISICKIARRWENLLPMKDFQVGFIKGATILTVNMAKNRVG